MLNKPINARPCNTCIDAAEDLFMEYEIPNNELIDYSCTFISELNTGKVKAVSSLNYNVPTSKVTFDASNLSLSNNKEYSWASYYWKTPTAQPENYMVCGIDKSNNELSLKPKGNVTKEYAIDYTLDDGFQTTTPDFIVFSIDRYGWGMYVESYKHETNEDTSNMCSNGQLTDYYGYWAMKVGATGSDETYKKVVKSNIPLGKIVLALYDMNGRLVTLSRVLAYDFNTRESNYAHLIVDNTNIHVEMSGVEKINLKPSTAGYDGSSFYKISRAEIYNIDDFEAIGFSDALMRYSNAYCLTKNMTLTNGRINVSLYPSFPTEMSSIAIGDNINLWNRKAIDINTTPPYYFRYKSVPTTSLSSLSTWMDYDENNDVYILKDIKCRFNIEYSSPSYSLNYYYLYLYGFNQKTQDWQLVESSPMLYHYSDTYEFLGLVDGQRYKVFATCSDVDGDDWSTNEIIFDVDINLNVVDSIAAKFNKKDCKIDINFIKPHDINIVSSQYPLTLYSDTRIEFYRCLKSDTDNFKNWIYAGGGLATDGRFVLFDSFSDYNIKNDSCYDYIVRVEPDGQYDSNGKARHIIYLVSDIYTDFEGTSILGLKKVSDTNIIISDTFKLNYDIGDTDNNELTNEISRQYIDSFSRYQKELKGHKNYIATKCSGLLGSEHNGFYKEPKGIRDAWIRFVDDDSIKLYRGIDGETMIISIETNKIKPYNFPGTGIVNKVNIGIREIASVEQYAIFTTTYVGD